MGAYAQVAERLIERGYAAIPIMPGTKRPGFFCAGMWRGLTNWQTKFVDQSPSLFERQLWSKGDTGIGVVAGPASGGMIGADIDTDDSATQSCAGAWRRHHHRRHPDRSTRGRPHSLGNASLRRVCWTYRQRQTASLRSANPAHEVGGRREPFRAERVHPHPGGDQLPPAQAISTLSAGRIWSVPEAHHEPQGFWIRVEHQQNPAHALVDIVCGDDDR